jgi:hypothetical protein
MEAAAGLQKGLVWGAKIDSRRLLR